jgi:hypothetical protein
MFSKKSELGQFDFPKGGIGIRGYRERRLGRGECRVGIRVALGRRVRDQLRGGPRRVRP